MRRSSLVGLVFASSVAVAACSLFVDTSGLEGGGDASEAGSVDASGFDSGTSDAGATDAGIADAGFTFECDATLCDDFDESDAFAPVWLPNAGTGGEESVVPKGKSFPNAFEPTVVVQSGESNTDIDSTFSSTPAAFRLELDFFLPAGAPQANEADIVDIEARGSLPSGDHLYLATFDSQWEVAEFANLPDGGKIDVTKPCVVSPELGAWNHLLLTSDGSTWSVSVNGVVAGSIQVSPAAGESGIPRILHLGWTYVSNNTAPLDAYFDDVSMTFLP